MSSPESPYVSGSELPPETKQGFIELRQKVAAGIERISLAAARIEEHSESDERHHLQDAEGEQ